MELNGTEKITPTPFDAHEKVVRGTHENSKDGLKPAEYEHQEYPKAVAHREDGEPVVATSAEHEEQLRAEKEDAL
jgi:hypothetical protein